MRYLTDGILIFNDHTLWAGLQYALRRLYVRDHLLVMGYNRSILVAVGENRAD